MLTHAQLTEKFKKELQGTLSQDTLIENNPIEANDFFSFQIQQLATAKYVSMHPEIEFAMNKFLDTIKPLSPKEKESLTQREQMKITNNFHLFSHKIRRVNKKIAIGQTKIPVKKLELAAIAVKELGETQETLTAFQNLIKTIQQLIDLNEKDLPFKNRKTAKKQLRKSKQFIQDTSYFREHIADYFIIYSNLTDETQKQDFERFIEMIYQIDKNLLLYGTAPDLDLFESAFISFQKITDPFYHQLTAQEIANFQWKKEIWTTLNFLIAATLTAFIATVVLLPWTVFFPILIVSLLLMCNAVLTKGLLHDESERALLENEISQAEITFKKGYSDHLFALFPPINKNIESKETAANWHRHNLSI